MKTVVSRKIIAEIDKLAFGYWDEGEGEFIKVDEYNFKEAAKEFECSENLVSAILFLIEELRTHLKADLMTLYEDKEI